jgi:hypothetical protein
MSQGVFAEGVVNTQPGLYMAQTVSLADFQSNNGIRLLIDILPASYLSSPDIDGFEVTRTSGGFTDTEKIDGTGSWIPNLRGGLSFDTGPAYIEPTVGGGYLVNGAFTTPMLMGDLACRFKLGDAVTLGPHIGLINFGDSTWNRNNTEWDEDVDVDIKGTTGYMGGLALTAGGETVAFSCSVDYVSAKFDVKTGSGWTANKDELDMSGWAVNLGVAFRF